MQNITQLLGFDKDENKNLVVNPEQAKTIKRIYAEFGEGKTPIEIAAGLTQDGILTPTKKTKWIPGTILTILKNEKYKGDAIFQKTYQKDFLDKRVKNEGQAPMYIFTNHHEAIIDREYWDWVQMEIKRRIESCHEEGHRAYSLSGHPMAGMLICGECGSYLRRYRQNRSATVYADTWICKKHVDEGRDLYFALEKPVTAEELLTEFQLKYMCDTVSLGTMKKVVRTCEEDSKIPKLTAGTLSKRIARKPTKLEQERIAMLLNRE